MACFLVPAAEAIVTGVVSKAKKSSNAPKTENEEITGWTWHDRFALLTKMLVGGAVLLAFEHVWHGEVVPFAPFLTAMTNPADKADMLHEMATVGVAMSAIVTTAWAGICVAAEAIVKRAKKALV